MNKSGLFPLADATGISQMDGYAYPYSVLILLFTILLLSSCGEIERNPFDTGGADSTCTIVEVQLDDDLLTWNSGDLSCRIRIEYGDAWKEFNHFAYSTDDSYAGNHEVRLLGADVDRAYYFRICAEERDGSHSWFTDSDSLLVVSAGMNACEELLKFVMLNVEEGVCIGDCLFMRTPTGEHFVIDSGYASRADYIHDFLLDEDATTVDYAWFTHCHGDHYGGFEGYGYDGLWYRNDLTFVNFYYPSSSTPSYGDTYDRLKGEAESQCQIAAPLPEGAALTLGNVEIRILHSGAMDYTENNSSIMAHITYHDLCILCGGDAEHGEEYEVLGQYPDLLEKVNVFKVHHHGRGDANGENFIAAMEPRICMIPVDQRSSGPGYPLPLPYPSVIEMLHDYRVDIFRVDRTDPYSNSYRYGDIKLISDGYYFEVSY